MKIVRMFATTIVTLAVMFGTTQAVAPTPASASSSTHSVAVAKAPPTKICKDARFNWRLTQKVTNGGYTMWSYYSSSHQAACVKSRKNDGVKSNFLLKITRHFKDGTKRTGRVKLLNRTVAWKAFGKVGRATDVAVYAGPVTETKVYYKTKFTLRF